MSSTRHPYLLVTDGAARGNPGPAAIAYSVHDANGERLFDGAETIGHATNNEAEYRALIAGLDELARVTTEPVHHVSDSELLIKQLTGEYRIRADHLARFVSQVHTLEDRFEALTHEHRPREDALIEHVDELANEALDAL